MKEDDLQRAWKRYQEQSSTPHLLNFEDFSAGFGAAMGGLGQFMRMKVRIRDLEEQNAYMKTAEYLRKATGGSPGMGGWNTGSNASFHQVTYDVLSPYMP